MNNKKNILTNFGKNISKLRKERKLSQETLANKSGLHRTHIGMIERAERNITLLNIEKLAKGLEVSIDELFRF
ncbi:MunI regulatory protein [hydrothermal vent metagenome]|uniref:MunI regulatory protein n=1 Tax=hydrothermal vent metagenome TaxID=652676 RepID=A0A1W1C9C7_9ZZZZ